MARRVEHDPWEGHYVQTSRPTVLQGGAVARLNPHTRMGYVPLRPAHVCLPGEADRRKRDTEGVRQRETGLSTVSPSPTSNGTRPVRGPRVATPRTLLHC
eukprot:9459149-Heterocapsa_arctica.AAC.1